VLRMCGRRKCPSTRKSDYFIKDTSLQITIYSMTKPEVSKQYPLSKKWEVRVEYRVECRMGRCNSISNLWALLPKIEWITLRMSLWLTQKSHLLSATQPKSVTSTLGHCPSKNTIKTSEDHFKLKRSLQWCSNVERCVNLTRRHWSS